MPQSFDEHTILASDRADIALQKPGEPPRRRRLPGRWRIGDPAVECIGSGPTASHRPRPDQAWLDSSAEPVEFTRQRGPVAAALGPAPVEISGVGIKDARAWRLCPTRWFIPAQPAPHGLAIEAEMAREARHRGAGRVQAQKLGIARVTGSVPFQLALFGCRGRTRAVR